MSTVSTKETREALAAILALSIRYREAMLDFKLTKLEILKFLFDLTPAQKALENVHLIPAEMLDLKADEMPEIIADISNILNAWGVSHRTQDIAAMSAKRIPFIIDLIQALIAEFGLLTAEIQAQPPSAEPA